MSNMHLHSDGYAILHNNVKMPLLGLGTSHNGGYSHEAVVYALTHCGYRHIDTAKRYGCERFIAQAIKDSSIDRNEIFLTTKCWPTDYGKDNIRAAVEGSCERLGTNYLDLYLLHWPFVPTGYNRKELINETWRTLELLYDDGLMRSIGVSNFSESHLDDLLEEAVVTPHVNQCEFHPFNNPVSLRQMCQDNNIQFEGFSPLAKGRILNSPILSRIALSLGRTPAQILLRWCLQNGSPIIPKSRKPIRVFENSQIFDFDLADREMDILNSLPQCLTVIDRSCIQEKIDNPVPDGYKLNLIVPDGYKLK